MLTKIHHIKICHIRTLIKLHVVHMKHIWKGQKVAFIKKEKNAGKLQKDNFSKIT